MPVLSKATNLKYRHQVHLELRRQLSDQPAWRHQHAPTRFSSTNRKCEFILVWDTVMTDSAKYADILLPDAMRSEQLNLQTQGYTECYAGVVSWVGPAQEAPWRVSLRAMTSCADIADTPSAYKMRSPKAAPTTNGYKHLYEQGAAERSGSMPTWEEMLKSRAYTSDPLEPYIASQGRSADDPCRQPPGNPFRQNRDLLRSSS